METNDTQAGARAARPWTFTEKLFLAAVAAAVLFAISHLSRQRSLDAPPVVPRPSATAPAGPNGYQDLAAAALMVTRAPGEPDGNGTASSWRAAALARLRQGLAKPIDASARGGHGMSVPMQLASLAQAIRIQAITQENNGQWTDAVQTCLDGVEFGERQGHGGDVDDWSAGTICAAIARQTAWAVVDHLDARTAQAAANRLSSIERTRTVLADNLSNQKYEDLLFISATMQRADWRPAIVAQYGTASPDDPAAVSLTRQLGGMSKQQVVDIAGRMSDRVIADARRPYLRVQNVPTDPVEKLLYRNSYRYLPFRDSADLAQNRLLETALALQAYREKTGSYPAALANLCPSILPAPPGDPFAPGRPLQYRRSGATYVLWSVGPDQQDDGGRPWTTAAADPRGALEPTSVGDVVAGADRP